MSLRQMHVVALLAVLLTAGPALAQGRWSQMKPIPQGEEEVVGVALDSRMYVLGGLGAFPGWEPKQIFFRYDPAANEWSRLPSLPEGVHHPGVAAVGGKIYVMGGFTISRPAGGGLPAWVPTSSVWVFDLAANAWSKGVPLPTPRGALTATAAGKWSPLRPMLTARNHHGAALIDGRIYVVGGRVGSTFIIGLSTNVSTNEVYDVAKDTWSSVLGVPTARSGVGVAVLEGRMHVLGGEAYLNDLVGTFRTHEAYDPKSNSWQRLPPMPTPRHGLAVAEIGGRIYAVSGANVAGGGGPHEGVQVNEAYDPR